MAFDGPDGYAAAVQTLARIIEPHRPMPISAWADKYRMLARGKNSEPGKWRNSRVPFVVEPMDALNPRHPAPVVVFTGSSQVAKSEVGLNWIGWLIHEAPESLLAMFPSETLAKRWMRQKLEPMIGITPELARIIPAGRRSDAGNTITEKQYRGCTLQTGSTRIPENLRMLSMANLLLEEASLMEELEGEGDPIELAIRRLSTYPRSKVFIPSSPTTEKDGVWPWWLRSTMDRYFVPCVHCNHMQVLRWQQLQWTPGNPEGGAYYVCEECAAVIEERHKTEMLAAGQWRATHPERENKVKGFHINGLYTPAGLGDSWAKHAEAWERAQGSIPRIQVFTNSRLGEVHKGEQVTVEWEEVKRRVEPYRLRDIPKGVLLLTSGTDVQADRLETQILGHGRNEQITVIDYVVHYGDTTQTQTSGDGVPSVWAKLDDYLAREIVNAYGVKMRLSCSLVDAGYLPDTVLWFTRPKKARGIYASRGSTNATRQPIGKPSHPDVKRRGKTDARTGAERYEIGVSVLKHWLYEVLRADAGTNEIPVQIADRHVRFSFELAVEYFRQLTAETFDPKHGWDDRANYHRNEALDTFILGRAAAMHHSVNLHRMREADFVRLEELYEPKSGAVVKVAELGKQPIPRVGGFLPTSAKTKDEDKLL